MFYHPLSTGMERIRVITALRQPAILVPSDFDEHLMPQVTHMTRFVGRATEVFIPSVPNKWHKIIFC